MIVVRGAALMAVALVVVGCSSSATVTPSAAPTPSPVVTSSPSPEPTASPSPTVVPLPTSQRTPEPTPTPLPSAITDLLSAPHLVVGADAVTAIAPPVANQAGGLPSLLVICQRGGGPAESGKVLLYERERGCLLAIAVLWTNYLTGFAQQDFTAAQTIYSYAVDALGSDAKAFIDAALVDQFGPGFVIGPRPNPTLAHSVTDLFAAPHRKPTAEAVALAMRDAAAANLAVGSTRILQGFGMATYSRDGTTETTAIVTCAISSETLGCEGAADVAWRHYRQTGSEKFYVVAKYFYELAWAKDGSIAGRRDYLNEWMTQRDQLPLPAP